MKVFQEKTNRKGEFWQHLLGTSVLVFLLLPLVLSIPKTKEAISQDYKHIIQNQLASINLSIQKLMDQNSMAPCTEKKLALQNLSPLQRIQRICSRLPTNISGHLQPELPNLVRDIEQSLGWQCSQRSQNKEAAMRSDSQPLQRKFCKLKRLLVAIQKAYEQYNSTS